MKILKYDSKEQSLYGPSVFFAGPTHREQPSTQWRKDAVELFRKHNFKGTLVLPEFVDKAAGEDGLTYDYIIDWELNFLTSCNHILFWIPRNLNNMPAFTTNVEFGMFHTSPRTWAGSPVDAPKNRYLKYLWKAAHPERPWRDSLEDIVIDIVKEC